MDLLIKDLDKIDINNKDSKDFKDNRDFKDFINNRNNNNENNENNNNKNKDFIIVGNDKNCIIINKNKDSIIVDKDPKDDKNYVKHDKNNVKQGFEDSIKESIIIEDKDENDYIDIDDDNNSIDSIDIIDSDNEKILKEYENRNSLLIFYFKNKYNIDINIKYKCLQCKKDLIYYNLDIIKTIEDYNRFGKGIYMCRKCKYPQCENCHTKTTNKSYCISCHSE